jgi:hypothetical protein
MMIKIFNDAAVLLLMLVSLVDATGLKMMRPRSGFRVCPTPALGVCPAIYLPVKCGPRNCIYDNECIAKFAGFDAATQCTLVGPPPESTECPTPANGACPFIYLPVKCGPNNCEYSNDCIANLAGFNTTAQCTLVSP